jgi:NAD-dependent dihydropyrimidine dehydrogenase PreA subunit
MKRILVCLNCGSTRLKRKTHFLGIIPGSCYVCKDCGFESPVMLEVSKDEEKKN